MLQFIRDRAQGVFAWILVGFIIVPFALWGINQYNGGGDEPSVATVNGSDITERQLQQSYLQQRERMKQMFGEQLPEQMISEEVLKPQVLQRMIQDRLIYSTAYANQLRVSDAQLGQFIRQASVFQDDGVFSADTYRQVLRMQGKSPGVFEEELRRDLLDQQFSDGIRATEFVTDYEAQLLARLQSQQRKIGYMTLPLAQFMEGLDISDERVADYYQNNIDRYMVPERVSVTYLEVSAATIASGIDVTADEVKEYYDTHIDNYRTPEERQASHILIEADGDWEAAMAKASALREKITAGADFAELAKTESADTGSAANGGELGFIARNSFDEDFEKALFALKLGEISAPVRSSAGVHLIRLEEVRGGEEKPFAEVKQQIEADIRQERAEERFYDLADKLDQFVFENKDTLQVAADELGIKVKESPLFSRSGGSGLVGDAKVAEAAFSDDVLERGYNSEVLEVGENHLIALRVKEHQPKGEKPLEQVKASIVATLKREDAKEKADALAKTLLAELDGGGDAVEIAKKNKLEWKEQSLSRDSKDVDQALRSKVFSMPKPADDAGVNQSVVLANGDRTVVQLQAVEEQASEEKAEADPKLARANELAGFDAVLAALKAEAKITIRTTAE